jgi:phage shock protein C
MSKNMKKLYRSNENKIFFGIVGGLGEYFEVDPVALRVLAVLICVLTGVFPILIVYIVVYFIIPKKLREN